MLKKKYVWVEIELNKVFNKLTLFRGKILEKDLIKWTKGKYHKRSIKIENTYWYDFVKEKVKIYYTIPGQIKYDSIFYNFTGTYYILSRNIISIATLKNDKEYFTEIKRINHIFDDSNTTKKVIL